MSEAARERAAYQASLQMIQGGERPVYRVMPRQDGSWSVLGFEWLAVGANESPFRRGGDEGSGR